jgi:hypothetical protein
LFPVFTGQPFARIRKEFVDRAPGETLDDALRGETPRPLNPEIQVDTEML